jgi:hypothetical protein
MSATCLYLHGFASSPASFKARRFKKRFAERGIALEVPALDEGDFESLTLSRQRALVERLLAGAPRPHVLVGSSMGGYLALLHAEAHPVDALVVMAPAVNFVERWRLRLPADEAAEWERTDRRMVQHFGAKTALPLRFDLLRDAPRHSAWPVVTAPTLVLQGANDETVPLELVQEWVDRTPVARMVTYDSGHELQDVAEELCSETFRFLATVPAVRAAVRALQ